jgi:hypothetical protein
VKTMARKGKTSCQLESSMVYVKKCIFRHESVLRKIMAEALHNGQ